MLYVRFREGDRTQYGILQDDEIEVLKGDLFGQTERSGETLPLSKVRLVSPVPQPGKILAAAVNYETHAPSGSVITKQDKAPTIPQLFLKPSSSIVGPDETIVLPEGARRVDAEGELVAVIGRTCRSVSAEAALDYVFGYTCGNDVSARHWQRDDLQWWRAKGADTFSPIGPAIAAGLDPSGLELRTLVNGDVRQATNTGEMVHSVAVLISFASQACTLAAGDLIFSGTPGETPTLNDSDVVEIEIGGIGVLRNAVARSSGGGKS